MDTITDAVKDVAQENSAQIAFFSKIFSDDWLSKLLSISIQIIFILILTILLKHLLHAVIDKLMSNKITNQIGERTGRDTNRLSTLRKLSKSIVSYILYFFAAVSILDALGINITAVLAGAGIASLAVAFGAQSIVQDLISGIFIIVENQYDVGEYIKIGDTIGKVEEIGMKTTKISSYNGEVLTIPNGKIQTVINYSRHAQRRNVDVGVAYEEDTTHAMAAVEAACQKINESDFAQYLDEKCHALGIFELADSSVVIRATFTAFDWKQAGIEMALRKEIKDTLDDLKVEISYPKLQLMS